MTEMEVFHKLCEWNGGPIAGQAEARAKLKEFLAEHPGYLYRLPESLLEKMGIRFDRQFDSRDLELAAAVHGRCARRILCSKP